MTPAEENGALADALVQLSFVLHGVLTRLGAERDLSATQVRLLAVLEDRELGMAQLARLLEIEKSSLSGLVDRAERRGLVTRRPVPGNGRATQVVLTAAARSLVAGFRARAQVEIDALAVELDGPRRVALTAAARSLLDVYGERHDIPW